MANELKQSKRRGTNQSDDAVLTDNVVKTQKQGISPGGAQKRFQTQTQKSDIDFERLEREPDDYGTTH